MFAQRNCQEKWKQGVTRHSVIPEVSTEWLSRAQGCVTLIDVRGAHERAADGHIPFSQNIPLGSLEEVVRGWSRGTPIVVTCRSGGRSARAAMLLERMGFKTIASHAGGYLDWQRFARASANRSLEV